MKGMILMDIYKALEAVPYKKREYFKWKFELYVNRTEELSEEALCQKLDVKTLNHMKKWEKSSEYLMLTNLYLESRMANDLEQIYQVTAEKALTGDEKAIKLLLDLQKQVRAFNKESKTTKVYEPIENDGAYDELELS
ncbi:hypothetical protein [Lysinibacillus sphaericus]|uniref:hypothetical protein n=1 Tax=Lysinibacillus sphaericus TaxID=1421 RepID=UPI001CBF0582|nr:hypothetical protein [Lysinibacillus sphaericus]